MTSRSRDATANKGVKYGISINMSKKSDLVQYLVDLHKSLCQMGQSVSERPKGFRVTADQLVGSKILNHSDKDVRLFASCCIVDTLRIFAPDAPYSDEDTIRAFDVLVAQMRNIATVDMQSAAGQKVNYLLESLGTVKSCVVPVMLAQQGVRGADETVTAMFDALLNSIRCEHSEEVFNNVYTVLVTCLEEMQDIDQDIIELLLHPFVPSCKTENPAAHKLSSALLRRPAVSASMEGPLAAYVNNVLLGAADEAEAEADSRGAEIAAHVYAVVYEMHKVAPSALIQVIPSLCGQLQTEDGGVRLKAVQLLGRLFSSSYAEYAKEFARNFREFLARINDKEGSIRQEVVASCGQLWDEKPDTRNAVEEALCKKLRDIDADVRLAALSQLLDILQRDPTALVMNTISEISERVKDKKADVRRAALVGLSKCFARYVTAVLPPLSSLSPSTPSSSSSLSSGSGKSLSSWMAAAGHQDMLDRLAGVPSLVVNSWGYPDSKHLVLQLLQEFILPKAQPVSDTNNATGHSGRKSGSSGHEVVKNCENRASAVVLLFQCLQSREVEVLSHILATKSQVNGVLTSFLEAHDAHVLAAAVAATAAGGGAASARRSGASGDTNAEATDSAPLSAAEAMRNMRQSAFRLAQLVPTADRKLTLFDKLYSNKDKIVYRLLRQCVGGGDSIGETINHRENLKQRLESKSAMGEYIPIAFDFASGSMFVNDAVMQALLKYAISYTRSAVAASGSSSKQQAVESVKDMSTLIFSLSRSSRQAFGKCARLLADWLQAVTGCDGTNAGSKRSGSGGMSKEMKQNLLYMCLSTIQNASKAICLADAAASVDLCAALIKLADASPDFEICERLAEIVAEFAYFVNSGSASLQEEQNSVDLTMSWVRRISSPKCLTLDNERLLCDLTAFASLIKVPVAVYTSSALSSLSLVELSVSIHAVRSRMFEFIAADLLGPREAGLTSPSTVRELCAGLKVLTCMLATEEELKQLGIRSPGDEAKEDYHSIGSNTPVASVEFGQLVDVLFDCIASGGETLAQARVDLLHPNAAALRSVIFETATQCAVSLTKIKYFGLTLSVDNWHKLGWALLDQSPAAARKLMDFLGTIVRTHPVHARFLAYPCLFASKDTHLCDQASRMLLFAVKRLRTTHQQLCGQAITCEDDEAESLKRLADSSMPETILPYLLHILSYHPEFPTSSSLETEEDKVKLQAVVACVRMLLRILHDSLAEGATNVSFLLKQLNLINQNYIDRHDNENIGLQFVTRVAAKIMNDFVKTSDNAQVYPGEIFLPSELYEVKVKARKSLMTEEQLMQEQQLSALASLGMEEAETAIERALHSKTMRGVGAGAAAGAGAAGTSRANKLTSPSPIKKPQPRAAREDPSAATEKRRAAAAAAAAASMPREEPSRRMPSRGAKSAVVGAGKYREVGESEREVAMWEKNNMPSRDSSSRRSSAASQLSEGSLTSRPVMSPLNQFASATLGRPSFQPQTSPSFDKKRKSSGSARPSGGEGDFDLFSSQTLLEDESLGRVSSGSKRSRTSHESNSSRSSSSSSNRRDPVDPDEDEEEEVEEEKVELVPKLMGKSRGRARALHPISTQTHNSAEGEGLAFSTGKAEKSTVKKRTFVAEDTATIQEDAQLPLRASRRDRNKESTTELDLVAAPTRVTRSRPIRV